MRRRIWLGVLILYAFAGLIDGASRLAEPPASGSHPSLGARLPVAFCAGLFWPIDIVARRLLEPS
jgi:hypothetical protein